MCYLCKATFLTQESEIFTLHNTDCEILLEQIMLVRYQTRVHATAAYVKGLIDVVMLLRAQEPPGLFECDLDGADGHVAALLLPPPRRPCTTSATDVIVHVHVQAL